jgi:Response regulator containing CheY-like receiver domain and AraC-type DNA-binding domain
MRLLIIDDDIPTVDVIKERIKWDSLGIDNIESAYNIESAKDIIRENIPDIIISDIEMPRGSGIDLIKWIRENQYNIQFIFLTCHESFEFASTAIEFEAVAYVTKPVNFLKLKVAVAKATDNIANQKRLMEKSQLGSYWLENQLTLEEGFWKDLLFDNFPSRKDTILSEINKRHLSVDIFCKKYRLILTTIGKSQIDELYWDESTFRYALRNLTSEILLGQIDYSHDFCITRNGCFYNIIVTSNPSLFDLQSKCENLVKQCKKHLQCVMTCYISSQVSIEDLIISEMKLQDMDVNNIMFKGKVVLENENPTNLSHPQQYVFDTDTYKALFSSGKKLGIINHLNKELKTLIDQNHLDYLTLHSIRQDFLQTVFTILFDHGIQAHSLFADEANQKLMQDSENSLFDMMRWATFITNQTIDYIKEVEQSENIIEKVKRFIHSNYSSNIGREEIAAHVFLTPDYLSKTFKAKTGLNISDYINQYRIEKAKALLMKNDYNISDIASETGFDSFSYFSTVFKKFTGKSPSVYKKEALEN